MKTKKPDILVLCYRCWSDYISAGFELEKIYTEFKQDCEMCGYHEGYEYIEVGQVKKNRKV